MMNPATVFPSVGGSFEYSILHRYTVNHLFSFSITINISRSVSAIRKWKLACWYSWAIFLVYEVSISIQSYTAADPLCAIIPNESGSSFYHFACAAAVSGFFFTFMMLWVRIASMTPGKERVASLVASDVVLKGLLCSLALVLFKWNGFCIDVLGYVLYLNNCVCVCVFPLYLSDLVFLQSWHSCSVVGRMA